MIDSARGLLSALQDGPVQLSDVREQPRDELLEAGVSIRETGGQLRLESLPDYGWPTIVAGLDVPLEVEYHESLPSTNDRARTLAESGRSGVAVIAGQQTGGRGRQGRTWHSPEGGVWCSVVLEPTLPADRRALLTFAAAISICRTAEMVGVQCEIKWPNDVLVASSEGARKLAGILTEAGSGPEYTPWVIVGMGLNADIPPERLPAGATSLRLETGGPVDRTVVAQRVLRELWMLRDAPERILTAWRSLTGTLGRVVQVETASGSVTGTAVEVTDTGALIVETQSGREVVAAGDCEHLRRA